MPAANNIRDRPMLDKLGRLIEVGSYIVYGHALGRCAGLKIGKVLSLETKPPPEWKTGYPDEYRVRVVGIDDDWGHQEPSLTVGTLQFPSRIVVLDRSDIPAEKLDLLDTFKGKTK